MQIRLLGPVDLVHDGATVPLGGPRQRAVLMILALGAPDVVSTDRLVDGIWGEEPPGKPLATLQVWISNLRKSLGAAAPEIGRDLIASRAPGYRLDPRVTTDLGEFRALTRQAQRARSEGRTREAAEQITAALGLWRGDALADLRDLPFADFEVGQLDELRIAALEDAGDLELELGRHRDLVAGLEERVVLHPTRERLWGQLMVALYRCDRQADALATYARARDRLADELGIDPGEALRAVELAILRQDPQLAVIDATPVTREPAADRQGSPAQGVASTAGTVAPRAATRMPPLRTPSFGRDTDVEELTGLLSGADARLVTLTGVGGAGKTRLAVLVAESASIREAFTERWFVALDEAVEEPLPALLARAAGLDPGEDALSVLAQSITVPTLAVLDNLEEREGVDVEVAALVDHCPLLTVLGTSRRPLRVHGEVERAVSPLPASDEASPAVRLFVSRAQAADPRFAAVSSEDAADVVALCETLDGLPLAIELAASRVRLMGARALRDQLGAGIDLLRSSAKDAPARQRTLASTLAWSVDQLGEDARALLPRLAVWEDGFTLQGVESVCRDAPGLLDSLGELMDASLVRSAPSRIEVRFSMLATLRSWLASEARVGSRPTGYRPAEDDQEVADTWLLSQVVAWEEEIDGPQGDHALSRFDDEAGNITSALERALARDDVETVVRWIGACDEWWLATGRLPSGIALVQRALALTGHTPGTRASLLAVLGKVEYHRADWEASARDCAAALAIVESGSDGPESSTGLTAACFLAASWVVSGRREDGAALAATTLSRAQEVEAYAVQAVAMSVLAIAAAIGSDFAAERRWYEERLQLVRRRGDRARLSDTLNTLAEIALDEGDHTAAGAFAAESRAISRDRLPLEELGALISLGRVAAMAGEVGDALDCIEGALQLCRRTGQRLGTAQAWRVVALLSAPAHPATAVRLYAAAQALSPSPSGEDDPVERDLQAGAARARASLGADAAAREWLLGGLLDPAAGSALAHEAVSSLRDVATGQAVPAQT